MAKYIDTHCHIIPGVDDGAENLEELKKMLRMEYEEGVRFIIATPHFHPIRGKADLDDIRIGIARVRREAAKIDKQLKVYLGMEAFYTQDLPDNILNGRVQGINNSKILLLEFSPGDEFSHIVQGIKLVQSAGVDIILAHCERYMCLVKNFEYISHLARLGVKFQVNAGSITGKSGRKVQKFIFDMMDEDYVFCVGTDAHNSTSRPPKMNEAANLVENRYGAEYMKKIFYINPVRMVARCN